MSGQLVIDGPVRIVGCPATLAALWDAIAGDGQLMVQVSQGVTIIATATDPTPAEAAEIAKGLQ